MRVTHAGRDSSIRILLRRLVPRIAATIARQRDRGRSAPTDPIGALVIEDAEAVGLLSVLAGELESAPDGAPPEPPIELTGPLVRLFERFEVDRVAELALAAALGVEVDGRLARLVAFLNDHPGHARPTLALVWDLAEIPIGPARTCLLSAPVVRDGLIEIVGEGPLSTRELRVAPEVVERLVADDPGPAHATEGPALAGLVLPDQARERALAWLDAWRRGVRLPLVLEGPPGSGRRTLARALFRELGLGAVVGGGSGAWSRREARWSGSGIVATEIEAWSALDGFQGPVALVAPPGTEAVRSAMRAEPVTVKLAVPDAPERSALWRSSAIGARLEPGVADDLAARFPFTPGRIRRAAERALAEPWAPGLVHRVCRDLAESSLGGLAQRLSVSYRRADLVVSDTLDRELTLMLSWVKHRKQVLGDWGFGRRLANGWGVTALLAGPPGTGKTMAAQVVARELDADVYRVDLSRVVSKYIGETEKHLGSLLDEASATGAVLLFDEADALFGRRSEVRDAHDRYANLEVGFLLQRIEAHDGIVLLSTNRSGDMDEAFQRRFQFVLTFPFPDRELRERIWRGLLPPDNCAPEVDLVDLAERFHLTGGEIRNAVLAAAFLAAADGRPIGQGHLLTALRREIHKTGRVLRSSERA